jgi:hypothetical protein
MKHYLHLLQSFLALLLLLATHHLNAQVSSFPYSNDFEQQSNWTTGSMRTGTRVGWAHGNPSAKTYLNQAHSGNNVWATNLNGYAFAGLRSFLESPDFDFSSLISPKLSFWYTAHSDSVNTAGSSGMNVWYSTDQGRTWQLLGSEQDSTWYHSGHLSVQPGYPDTTSNSTTNVPGFTATGSHSIIPWTQAQHIMPALGGQPKVRFRFHFADDSTTWASADGFLLDDITIEDGYNLVLSYLDTLRVCPGMPVQLEVPANGLASPYQVSWSTGDTSMSIVVDKEGLVWSQIVSGQALQRDSIFVKFTQPQHRGGLILAHLGFRKKDSVFDCNNTQTSLYFIPNSPFDRYAWTLPNGQPDFSPQLNSQGKGLYKLQIADINGCVVEDSIHMILVSAPLVLLPDEAKSCDSVDVNLTLGPNPTASYFPLWQSPGSTMFDTLPVKSTYRFGKPGIFIFEARDGLNYCLVQDTVDVYVGPMNNVVSTTPDYGSHEGSACLGSPLPWGGNPPLAFDWDSSGVYGSIDTVKNLPEGVYTVYIRDVDGCEDTASYHIDWALGVFPGDTDRDGMVSMRDLLPMGLYYQATGPVRPNASITWKAQQAVSWNRFLSNGADLCHTDIDGSGRIDAADTLAILQNYSHIHQNQKSSGLGPAIHFHMPAVVNPGDTLSIPVMIGDSSRPVKNLYGIAFSLQYDSTIIKKNSVKIDFSNSWMGQKGNDLLTLHLDSYDKSRADIGMVRNNLIRIAGYGKLCDVIVVIDDHIGKYQVPFRIEATAIFAIDDSGEEIDIDSEPGITGGATDIDPTWANSLELYPNPSKGSSWLVHPEIQQGTLSIYNNEAKAVGKYPLKPGGLSPIELGKSPPGVYILVIESSDGYRTVRKILRVP